MHGFSRDFYLSPFCYFAMSPTISKKYVLLQYLKRYVTATLGTAMLMTASGVSIFSKILQ